MVDVCYDNSRRVLKIFICYDFATMEVLIQNKFPYGMVLVFKL